MRKLSQSFQQAFFQENKRNLGSPSGNLWSSQVLRSEVGTHRRIFLEIP